MEQYDLDQYVDAPPTNLRATLEWFASIITQPMEKKDTIRNRTPAGNLIAEEAVRYVVPSPTLFPHQRMQLYNQQYWWRLQNTLQTNFPLVTRLFGRKVFNEKVAVPFLLKYPPNHWSLNTLGFQLPRWIRDYYKQPDCSLVENAAKLDWAFMECLIRIEHPPLNLSKIIEENPEKLLTTSFYLQPHLFLFDWQYDLFAFREQVIKEEADYWISHRLPKLARGKQCFFVFFRLPNYTLGWRGISKGEYFFLSRFKEGSTMEKVCAEMEKDESALYEEAAEHLQEWLQGWVHAGWLTLYQ